VRADTLMQFGAVSERVASEMAVGVRGSTGADLGISTTGIAGPGGGSPEKPVGLVHFCVSLEDRVITDHRVFPGYRTRVKREAARHALQMAIDAMNG
ncbi:MAG: CinA family protein, partial [Methanomassiliicoccales archaeon]